MLIPSIILIEIRFARSAETPPREATIKTGIDGKLVDCIGVRCWDSCTNQNTRSSKWVPGGLSAIRPFDDSSPDYFRVGGHPPSTYAFDERVPARGRVIFMPPLCLPYTGGATIHSDAHGNVVRNAIARNHVFCGLGWIGYRGANQFHRRS